MPATLTLWGMYQWDNTLFDLLMFPAPIFKDDLIKNILLECAELEVVYPDPDFLKTAIGAWAGARQEAWEHYINIMKVKYNPIENTDKYEDRTITDSENESTSSTENGQRTIDVTQQDKTKGKSLNALTRTQQTNVTAGVSAFDSENFSNSNTQLDDVDENADTTYTADTDTSVTRTDTDAHDMDTHTDKNRTVTHQETIHAHGNIGITSNQQMLTQEVEFWRWDFLHQVANEFRQKFCISVY